MSDILEDIVSEGERLLGIAAGQGVPLRLLGGVAVRIKAPDDPVILVAYAAEPRGDGAGGPPVARPGPEMSELADFEPGHLPPMAFSHDDRIVADWLALRRRQAEVA